MRVLTALPTVLAAFAVLPACRTEHAATPAAQPVAPAPARPRLKIALLGKSSSNPVFLTARLGAETAAREIGARDGVDIEIRWLTPPLEDARVQAQRIGQAVAEGVQALLVSCSDEALMTPAIDDAVAHGVAVMTFDSDAPRSRRFAYVGVDDFKLGQLVMRELATQIGGKGRVAVLAGNVKALNNLQRRVDGVRDEAARHPGLRVTSVHDHPETPEAAVAETLRVQGGKLAPRGWAMVGGWPLNTRTLLTELQPARTSVVAVDALPAMLVYVERGIAPVLLAQPTFLWGKVGVETIVAKLHHHRDVPAVVPLEPVRVTRQTLGTWARQLRDWGFHDVPEEYLARE